MEAKSRRNRKSIRLKDYDYSQDGFYFVTICTKNREYYFGNIDGGEMKLSEAGQIAQNCWKEIPQHFDNVVLDEYVIMPNHLHGIICINNDEPIDVGNRHACSLQNNNKRKYEKLPVIIGSFKSAVTRYVNRIQTEIYFAWQKSYYDHIIRDENALNSIRQYILNNPLKWDLDRDNEINIEKKYKEMLEY